MKKIILLFSLASVFCLSFFIDSVPPEISLGFRTDTPNFSAPEIQYLNETGGHSVSVIYAIKSLSDGNIVISLKHYANFFQRKLLKNFSIKISGINRTEEFLRQDIILPVRKDEISRIEITKTASSLWRFAGAIYKFSLLILFFCLIYASAIFACKKKNKIYACLYKDWTHETALFFKRVDPLYYKTFLISFAAMNIVFLYHTVHFIWGNHDWNFVKYGMPWFGAVWGGRLTENIFSKLLFGGDVLPVFYNMFNFASFSLGAVLLCVLWKIPKNLFSYLSVSLLLLLAPYTLSWLFVVNMIHFSLPAIVFAGILFAFKAAETEQKHTRLLNFLSVFLFLYAFFAYPPVLSTISVAFCGMLFMEYFFEEKKIMEIFSRFRFIIADVFVSGIIFKFFLKILPYMSDGVNPNAYMTQSVGFLSFFKGFLPCLKSVFMQLIATQPFLDFSYKMMWLAAIVLSLITLICSFIKRKTGKTRILCSIFLFLSALCASQASVFISLDKGIMFFSRIAMFGLLFFYVFSYSVLIKQKNMVFKNIAFVLFILISAGNISRDANAQKIWKLGFDAEKDNILKISHAIESHPGFDPAKEYIFAAFGKQHSFREDYYFRQYDLPDEMLLNYPFTPDWVPHTPFQFFAHKNYIKDGYSIFKGCLTPPQIQEKLNEDLADFREGAKNWPDKSSVLVRDNYIAVMFDRGTL